MSKLDRFLEAQEKQYETALKEIKSGKKQTCWMWFIFPQIKGLGFTQMSKYYSIENIDEAIEYLNNDTLRSRLIEISQAVLDLGKVDINQVMGFPDDLKLKSCMTLFKEAEAKSLDDEKCDGIFQKVLDQFYDGEDDPKTLVVLQRQEYEKLNGIENKEEEDEEEIKKNEKIFEKNISGKINQKTTIDIDDFQDENNNELKGNDNNDKIQEKNDLKIPSLISEENKNNDNQRKSKDNSNDNEEEEESKCCQLCIII